MATVTNLKDDTDISLLQERKLPTIWFT